MKKPSLLHSCRPVAATVIALVLSQASASAAVYNWGFNAAGNWNDSSGTTGWNAAGAYPNAVDDVANLSLNISAARTVTINVADATVGSLNLADTGSTLFGWTVATSDATTNRLTFATSGGNATLTSAGTANTISAPVVLNNDIDISASSALTLSGTISGTGAINKSGTGTVIINTAAAGSVTSGKTLTVTQGMLALTGTLANHSNLQLRVGATSGSNDSILNLSTSVGSNLGNSNTITIVAGNTGTTYLQQQNNGNGSIIQANVVLGSASTGKGVTLQNVNTAGTANSSSFLGLFSDPAGLVGPGGVVTFAGSGALATRFGNINNSYTGGTIITSGNVQLTNGTGSHFGTGPVTVNGGAFRTNGNGAAVINGYSSLILNADLNFFGSDSSGNNFANPVNLGATGTATSRIINTTNTAAGALTISGVISNGTNGFTTGITKTGSATLTLSGANTYTGATVISAGTIILGTAGSFDNSAGVNLGTSGSQGTLNLTSKAAFTFGTGQFLAGHGTINIGAGKTVTVSGSLAPGNSPGQINVTGNLALANTTATTMELAGTGGVKGADYDNVTMTGSFLYDGALSIVSSGGFDIYQTGTYSLFDFASQSNGFDSVQFGGNALSFSSGIWSGTSGGYAYSFEIASGDLTVIAVPEPNAFMMILAGTVLLVVPQRRRNRQVI